MIDNKTIAATAGACRIVRQGPHGIASRGLRSKWRHRNGLGMLDTMIALLILGIISAVAVPTYRNSADAFGVEAAARRVALDLAYAQKQAIFKSASVTVEFYVTPSNSYKLLGVADFRDPTIDYEVKSDDSTNGSQLQSADFNGDNVVIFNGYGLPDSGGTVVVSARAAQKTVTLEPSGAVTIQ